MVRLKRPKVIICDIEGTTTSVKYWGECLVPFIKYSTQKCLKDKWDEPLLQKLIDNLRNSTKEANKDGEGIPAIAEKNKNKDFIIHSIVNNVIHQMNGKRYGRALQHFQIYVWLYGYQSGELKGHIFPDVSKAFNNWNTFQNIDIYIYSSGVYLTQKLLFSSSVKGNLTPLIKDFLDVESYGLKTESGSYKKISKTIGMNSKDILFLSDNPKELVAAKGAGCQVVLVVRPNNKDIADDEKEGLKQIKSFEDLVFI